MASNRFPRLKTNISETHIDTGDEEKVLTGVIFELLLSLLLSLSFSLSPGAGGVPCFRGVSDSNPGPVWNDRASRSTLSLLNGGRSAASHARRFFRGFNSDSTPGPGWNDRASRSTLSSLNGGGSAASHARWFLRGFNAAGPPSTLYLL